MPVNGIGYGPYTPIAPNQQEPAQVEQKELAPKADKKAIDQVNTSNSEGRVDITV